MFELAALPLPSMPISAAGIALENAGTAGGPGEMTQGGGFETMLALQSAQPLMPVPADLPAPAIPAIVPANGKILPEAAMPVAGTVAANIALAESSESDGQTETDDRPSDVAKAEAALPDQAMIAAIFAAPQRLAPKPAAERPDAPAARIAETAAEPSRMPMPEAVRQAAVAQPNPAAFAATVAVAKTASIELAPADTQDIPAEIVMPANTAAAVSVDADVAAAAPVANRMARPIMSARADTAERKTASETVPETARALPVAAAAIADSENDAAPLIETADDLVAPVLHRAAEIAPQQDAQPTVRAEQRPERIDFATLVDTLNRAREEAEPNTVRASVAHADFGRVSMRFEQDDKGMSVAMSSADPGFVRAVTASSEAAAAQGNSDTPREQNPQTQARSGSNASGEGSRQQHSSHAETPGRPAAQLRDTLRRDEDSATPGGIFA